MWREYWQYLVGYFWFDTPTLVEHIEDWFRTLFVTPWTDLIIRLWL